MASHVFFRAYNYVVKMFELKRTHWELFNLDKLVQDGIFTVAAVVIVS